MKLVFPDPRKPVTINTGIFGFTGKVYFFLNKLSKPDFDLLNKIKSFHRDHHFVFDNIYVFLNKLLKTHEK